MKNMVLLPLLLLLISAWLPFHSVNANEKKEITHDVYQVELSFLSHEAESINLLFTKQATLTVKEDRYTLSISAKNDHILTHVTAVQQGNKTSTRLDRAENLVQFDIQDIHQKIELTGKYRLPKEHAQQFFSYEVLIQEQSLPVFDQIQPSDDTVHYQLLSDGKRSVMNDYVNQVIHVSKRDNRYYAQLEILQPSKVKGFTVEQGGNLVEPKVVSQNKSRIVQFEVEDFQKGTRIWMKVEDAENSHVQEEFLQITFDQQQIAKFLNKVPSDSKAVSSLTKRTEQPKESPTPTKQTTIEKEEKKERPSEKIEQAQDEIPPLLPEAQLEFDRTVDDVEEEPAEVVTQVASEPEELAIHVQEEQTIPFDTMKIGILFTLCILSGILLIRRLVKKNNVTSNE
ncbi:hypothetical protein CSV78_12665 [Sporosarcina sp. P16a]|uniref:NEAT domain-containing protein n=1 Tax=Sporosarcina TaxID=1569 RepID=UPI000A1694A9|nr:MULTISPECIES: NEAT domain-containing protein [Sporosarcina]ARJ39019.1 hypothetical protein SporoP8_09100 [Sporosarcina ureae]PIC66388.1 hypothetical protein CSV78_12665 [Sporosarcina sp. P16a]PIC93889.1 hypothetical protein CSV70_02010 [Sporosarcina sp. P25]